MRGLQFEGIELSNPSKKSFLVKTYLHVFIAVVAFVAMQYVMFQTGVAQIFMKAMGAINWLFVLMIFGVVSSMASRMAYRVKSLGMQYVALFAYVFLYAVISLPIFSRFLYGQGAVVQNAALVTLISFALLTIGVYVTKVDFSFLGGILRWLGFVAIALIVTSFLGPMLFGSGFAFTLGTWFSVGMIAYAGMAILYNTSNVMRRMPGDSRYVAASLALFSDIILMFWYVVRFMDRR